MTAQVTIFFRPPCIVQLLQMIALANSKKTGFMLRAEDEKIAKRISKS
jgi:hypothetical protein